MLKRMDTARINALGWHPTIPFERGLADAYAWFRDQETVRAY